MILDPKLSESNVDYKCRVSAPLFETLHNARNLQVITIAPNDKSLQKYSLNQLDSKVIEVFEKISCHTHYILYPEVSSEGRYHYHGIMWTNYVHSEDPESLKEWYLIGDESFGFIIRFMERKIGRTFTQRIESLTEPYTAYNVKSRRCESTSFDKILSYITKQVNSKDLIRFIKNTKKFESLLISKSNKKYDDTVTHVLTDLNNEQLLEPSMMDIDAFNRFNGMTESQINADILY